MLYRGVARRCGSSSRCWLRPVHERESWRRARAAVQCQQCPRLSLRQRLSQCPRYYVLYYYAIGLKIPVLCPCSDLRHVTARQKLSLLLLLVLLLASSIVRSCMRHGRLLSAKLLFMSMQNSRTVGVVHSMHQGSSGKIRSLLLTSRRICHAGVSTMTPWPRPPAWQLSACLAEVAVQHLRRQPTSCWV